MKYHGARKGYDPAKTDKARTDGLIGESPWPFPFRGFKSFSIVPGRQAGKRAERAKVSTSRSKRKHGRST